MKNKKVSILIITYNAEQFINKTLQSCLNQDYDDVEILVLDNNSKDDTVKIIKKINSNRIKLFQSTKNLGPYGGLNFLLDKANGKYIAIQDHDDIWLCNKISKQVEFLEDNQQYVGCGTNTWYYYEDKEILILNQVNNETNFVDHTSLMFRNKSFRYNTNYLLADEHFEKKVLTSTGKLYCLQKGLTIHRLKKDGRNLSNSRFRLSINNIKEFFEINNFDLDSLKYLFFLLIIRFLPTRIIWFIRLRFTQRNRKKMTLIQFKQKHPRIDL